MKTRYSKKSLSSLYEMMCRIRYAEESLVGPISENEISCPCHLYSGQEAVAAGVCAALNREDYVFGNHRSHGHYLAKGGGLNEMIAEIYGASSGCARGRGGSMHVIAPERGMLGAAPIVGGTISLALGAALAASIRNDGKVAVSFFGDGSTGEGTLFESLNFAALKKLPILFVCENNLYSTHMSIRDCRPRETVSEIAEPFGIESCRVDGNDVIEVYDVAARAVERARNGDGPTFIECLTYRMRGHVGPDDNIQGTHTDIRPPEEIQMWRERDPIQKLRSIIVECGHLTDSELDAIDLQIKGEVAQAHELAKEIPDPSEGELLNYVFK